MKFSCFICMLSSIFLQINAISYRKFGIEREKELILNCNYMTHLYVKYLKFIVEAQKETKNTEMERLRKISSHLDATMGKSYLKDI